MYDKRINMNERLTNPEITQEMFEKNLRNVCDRETSQDPDGWSPENPLWGHCAIVSLAAQELFGGELLRASLADIPGYEHMRSHYWNKIADGTEKDFTRAQFLDKYPKGLVPEKRTREYVLSFPEKERRYQLFISKLFNVWLLCL